MNNNDFYNGGQPQNNMNPGMPGMQPQYNQYPLCALQRHLLYDILQQ